MWRSLATSHGRCCLLGSAPLQLSPSRSLSLELLRHRVDRSGSAPCRAAAGGGGAASFEAWLAQNPLPGTARNSSSSSGGGSSSSSSSGKGVALGAALESPPASRARQRKGSGGGGGSRQQRQSGRPEQRAHEWQPPPPPPPPAPAAVRRAWEFPVGCTREVLEAVFLGRHTQPSAPLGPPPPSSSSSASAPSAPSTLSSLLTPAAVEPSGSLAPLSRTAKPTRAAAGTLHGQAAAAATAAAAAATAAAAAEGVHWDPERRAFSAGGVRVLLPRLAPRPGAAGRSSGGQEGWELGGSGGGGLGAVWGVADGTEGRRLLLSYLDKLQSIQQGQQQQGRQQQGQGRQQQGHGPQYGWSPAGLQAPALPPPSGLPVAMAAGGGGASSGAAAVQLGAHRQPEEGTQGVEVGEVLMAALDEGLYEGMVEGMDEDEDEVEEDAEDDSLLMQLLLEQAGEHELGAEAGEPWAVGSGASRNGKCSSSSSGSGSSSRGGRASDGGGAAGPLLQPVNTGMVLLSADRWGGVCV